VITLKIMRPAFSAGLFLLIFAFGVSAQIQRSQAGPEFRVVELASGFNRPWSLALVPPTADGVAPAQAFVSERPGRLWFLEGIPAPGAAGEPRRREVGGLPNLFTRGQGGLLDIVLHPDYGINRRIYFSAAIPGSFGSAGTAVYAARFDPEAMQLRDLELLFQMEQKNSSTVHFGSRLAIGADGALYISTGDRGSPDRAQDREDSAGAILRVPLRSDGTAGGPAEIYSYGHRNVQGMLYDAASGALIAHEHGPRGGDEINLIIKDINYGWPLVSYGVNYNGSRVSDFQSLPGIAEPLLYWTPSIAPSGFARYPETGVFAPGPGEGWSGDLFVGALAGTHLRRVSLPSAALGSLPAGPYNDSARQESLLPGTIGRIRDVRIDGAGYVYLINDAESAALYRLEPLR
jgi:glucose/arabinose dehydrogenase